ncbi:insertion element protein [Staphylococcus aureus]|uniref:Insertion element protein n=1 Tax=Staphylococcus aureus TaxID=1280 RepID=A0A380DI90_STAAU|nr:insertion element protein [Staphylococcus aureus]
MSIKPKVDIDVLLYMFQEYEKRRVVSILNRYITIRY